MVRHCFTHPSVRALVRPSVRPSVRRSVRRADQPESWRHVLGRQNDPDMRRSRKLWPAQDTFQHAEGEEHLGLSRANMKTTQEQRRNVGNTEKHEKRAKGPTTATRARRKPLRRQASTCRTEGPSKHAEKKAEAHLGVTVTLCIQEGVKGWQM